MKLWIARDEDGFIGLYYKKPIYRRGTWYGSFIYSISKSQFPEVTFENSPQEVELKLMSEL